MKIFDKLFQKKASKEQNAPEASSAQPLLPMEGLMTSQLPALYLRYKQKEYRDRYIHQLMEIGFQQENAEKMFEFECDIIRKYDKPQLLRPEYTETWCFSMVQPFFQQYPNRMEDILKERYLTMSELCKLVDEAEWHYWNCHELSLPDEVWDEIRSWRLNGPGMRFALKYFDMIAEEAGIPRDNVSSLCNLQGTHLCKYKWK